MEKGQHIGLANSTIFYQGCAGNVHEEQLDLNHDPYLANGGVVDPT